MSKPKLKSKASAPSGAEQARVAGKTIMDSAQTIWLAGLGAFAKAQVEGTKLFEALVKEGMTVEQKTRTMTERKVGDVRGAVESTVGQMRERTQETWDRLEKVFEERVSKALGRLGVPGRDDLKTLIARVDELNGEVRKLNGQPAARKPSAATPAAAKKSTTKTARVRDELADVAAELEAAQIAANGNKRKAAAPPAKKSAAKPSRK